MNTYYFINVKTGKITAVEAKDHVAAKDELTETGTFVRLGDEVVSNEKKEAKKKTHA